jgi:hypothetical protein
MHKNASFKCAQTEKKWIFTNLSSIWRIIKGQKTKNDQILKEFPESVLGTEYLKKLIHNSDFVT